MHYRLLPLTAVLSLLPLPALAAPSATQLLDMVKAAPATTVAGELHAESRGWTPGYVSLWFSGSANPAQKEGTATLTLDVAVPKYAFGGRVRGSSIVTGGKAYLMLSDAKGTWDNPVVQLSISGLMKRWVMQELPDEVWAADGMSPEERAAIDAAFTVTERTTAQGKAYDFKLTDPTPLQTAGILSPYSSARHAIDGTLTMNAQGAPRVMTMTVGVAEDDMTAKGTVTVTVVPKPKPVSAPADALSSEEAYSLITGEPITPHADVWSDDAMEEWDVPDAVYTPTPAQRPTTCSGTSRSFCAQRPTRRSIRSR